MEKAETTELFRRLHYCGAISIEITGTAAGTDDLTGVQRPEEIAVALTPVGVYGIREYLLGTGCDAPVRTE